MKKVDVLQYAVQAKGISIGAHGIRSERDYPSRISYVCSVQGGDHTSTTGIPLDGAGSELWEIFHDSGVYCNFNSFSIPSKIRFQFYKAVTGIELTSDEWVKTKAMRVLQLQRAMLLLGGPDAKWDPTKDDVNPPRFYEPLPSGPCKGKAVDKVKVNEDRKTYYKEAGWDRKGLPKSTALRRLGLQDVDKALDKLR
jgi:aldehyde:ferredoxin oxidoreductase